MSGVDLAQWLGAQMDVDERIARAATKGPWLVDCETYAEALIAGDGTSVIAGGRWGGEASAFESTEDAIHIAEHDPARVLREIEAKRGIVARHEFACHEAAALDIDEEEREKRIASAAAFQSCVLLIAAVYEARPGYAEAVASAA